MSRVVLLLVGLLALGLSVLPGMDPAIANPAKSKATTQSFTVQACTPDPPPC